MNYEKLYVVILAVLAVCLLCYMVQLAAQQPMTNHVNLQVATDE